MTNPMTEILQIIATLLFFYVYYTYNIYIASLCLSIMAVAQLLISKIIGKKESTLTQSSLILLAGFGFSTWYFSNPLFIQWKITIANALFGVFILSFRHLNQSAFFSTTFRASNMDIPEEAAKIADTMLAAFFITVAIINYLVFNYCSEATWVLFKTSIIFINIIYLVFISLYLSQYAKPLSAEDNASSNH